MARHFTIKEADELISKILKEETGYDKEFFENTDIVEIEKKLGIPHYNIVDASADRRCYDPFRKKYKIKPFDEKLLIDY